MMAVSGSINIVRLTVTRPTSSQGWGWKSNAVGSLITENKIQMDSRKLTPIDKDVRGPAAACNLLKKGRRTSVMRTKELNGRKNISQITLSEFIN
tara:strand:- start:277 stop:561 length:285 start_codon:yes stop_codon:yes gene_type:complete